MAKPAFPPDTIRDGAFRFVARLGPLLEYRSDRDALYVLAPPGAVEADADNIFRVRTDARPAFDQAAEAFRNPAWTDSRLSTERVRLPQDASPLDETWCWETAAIGETLDQRLKAAGPVGRRVLDPFARSLSQALGPLHSAGLAHLGLRLNNVGVQAGRIVVGPPLPDFRTFLDARTGAGFDLLSLYEPLEYRDAAGRVPLGPATDVYAASALLFRLGTATAPPPPLLRLRSPGVALWATPGPPEMSDDMRRVIERGLSLRIEDRFASISEWLEALGLDPDGDDTVHFDDKAPPASSAAVTTPPVLASPVPQPAGAGSIDRPGLGVTTAAVQTGLSGAASGQPTLPTSKTLPQRPETVSILSHPLDKTVIRRSGILTRIVVLAAVVLAGAGVAYTYPTVSKWLAPPPPAPDGCRWDRDGGVLKIAKEPATYTLNCKLDGRWSPAPTLERFDYATVRLSEEALENYKPGLEKAMERLGAFYRLMGEAGRVDDFAKARTWFGHAADLNDRAAIRSLGEMALLGQGKAVDLADAEIWLRRASVAGDQIAKLQLARLLEQTNPSAANFDARTQEAVRYYQGLRNDPDLGNQARDGLNRVTAATAARDAAAALAVTESLALTDAEAAAGETAMQSAPAATNSTTRPTPASRPQPHATTPTTPRPAPTASSPLNLSANVTFPNTMSVALAVETEGRRQCSSRRATYRSSTPAGVPTCPSDRTTCMVVARIQCVQ
ncbi:hypothetical protein [Brevundimonas sp.]|uniref:hypothetical protein n=1 Tax=Brevundimonas sp. TaxID=1871086 RepID=UPI003D0CC5C1